METERITLALAIFFLHISRRVITAQDMPDENAQGSSDWFESVELSFWIALGLAGSVIASCLCCIFCCKRKSLLNQSTTANVNQEAQTGEGQDNGAMDYSDPPPPYSDALKYVLSKDDEGLPEYSETYL